MAHWHAAANNLSVVERELTNTEGAREALAKHAQDSDAAVEQLRSQVTKLQAMDAELKTELTASKQTANAAARARDQLPHRPPARGP